MKQTGKLWRDANGNDIPVEYIKNFEKNDEKNIEGEKGEVSEEQTKTKKEKNKEKKTAKGETRHTLKEAVLVWNFKGE
jgi:hypothetical protein